MEELEPGELLLQFVEDQGAWPTKSRLLYFLGSCSAGVNYGKRMRNLVVELLHQNAIMKIADDIFVHCSEEENVPTQVINAAPN